MNILSRLLRELIRILLGRLIETRLELAKAEAAIAYLKAVRAARLIFIGMSIRLFCMVLIAGGLILVPIALCWFMPWENTTKAVILIVVGGAYVLLPPPYPFCAPFREALDEDVPRRHSR